MVFQRQFSTSMIISGKVVSRRTAAGPLRLSRSNVQNMKEPTGSLSSPKSTTMQRPSIKALWARKQSQRNTTLLPSLSLLTYFLRPGHSLVSYDILVMVPQSPILCSHLGAHQYTPCCLLPCCFPKVIAQGFGTLLGVVASRNIRAGMHMER